MRNGHGRWLRAFQGFVSRIQQQVAEDIVEHGSPHSERPPNMEQSREKLAEIARLAFEVNEELELLSDEETDPNIRSAHDDVTWADRDPNR